MRAPHVWLGSVWAHYGLALVASGLGVGLTRALPSLGEGSRFVLFAPIVAAAVWWGGLRPGLLAAGTAALGIAALFELPEGLLRGDPDGWVRIATFLVAHVALAWLVDAWRREKARAEALAAAQDEFVRLVGHELRTPLTALRLRLDLELRRLAEREPPTPDELRNALVASSHQVLRAGRLLGRLLDAARLETGKLLLTPRPTDLADLAAQVIASVQLVDRRHRITLLAPPTAWAEVDPTRVEQVLTNLLENAVKFGPRGSTIEVEIAETSGGVRLSVRDWGPGVPESERSRLFERGAQAHGEGYGGGLGLGLYVARSIADAHGGRLWAEFPPSGGSLFAAWLPAKAATAGRGEPAA